MSTMPVSMSSLFTYKLVPSINASSEPKTKLTQFSVAEYTLFTPLKFRIIRLLKVSFVLSCFFKISLLFSTLNLLINILFCTFVYYEKSTIFFPITLDFTKTHINSLFFQYRLLHYVFYNFCNGEDMKTEIFESKKVYKVVGVLKHLAFFVMFYVLANAGIKNNIYPFAIGLFVALCWCNQNMFLMAGEFVLAGYLATFSLTTLITYSVCAVVIIFVSLIHQMAKKPIKLWALCVYCVVSQAMLVYYNYGIIENLTSALISVTISTIFMLCSVKIFKIFLVKGVGLKLTIDEAVSLCFLLAGLSLGLSRLSVLDISFAKIFAVFVILSATYIYKDVTAIMVAVVLGLGESLGNGNLLWCAGYGLMALCSLCFRTSHPYYSILAMCLCDLVLGLYFSVVPVYNIFHFISTAVGIALFLVVYKYILPILKILFGAGEKNQTTRNIVNRSRDELCKRMYEMSNIFFDMNKTFRNMVKGVLPVEEAKRMLGQEVMQKVCGDCPERYKCLRALADETSKVFDDIISAGFERGKTTILDVPPFLSTRCARVNTLLQTINQLILSYKQYANMINSMDTSRVLIADQLMGVSELLKVLAGQTQKTINFDSEKESQIVDELNYYNILCSDVVYYEKDTETISVSMLVKDTEKDNPNILKALDKICGQKMLISSQVPSQTPNFFLNSYTTAPKYDLIYGSSGCPKFSNTISGDSYSFIKLTDEKVLLAICDGMGSGEQAQKTSDTAINLIENFYKAGFDNEIILNSVNKFLSMSSEENYSALDIAVVDLKTSGVDFIKVGAPEGLLKHQTNTEILESGALPLGILEEMKPTIVKKLVQSDDMLVLCSDGVIDNFGSVEALKQFVNNTETTNPQTLSQLILDETLLKCKNEPNDDCTVICARIFPRV